METRHGGQKPTDTTTNRKPTQQSNTFRRRTVPWLYATLVVPLYRHMYPRRAIYRNRAGFLRHPGMPGYRAQTTIDGGCSFQPVDCYVRVSDTVDFRTCVVKKYSTAIHVLRTIAKKMRIPLCDIRLTKQNGKRIAMKAYVYENDSDLSNGAITLAMVMGSHHDFGETYLPENFSLSSTPECKQESDNEQDDEEEEDDSEEELDGQDHEDDDSEEEKQDGQDHEDDDSEEDDDSVVLVDTNEQMESNGGKRDSCRSSRLVEEAYV